MQRIDGPLIGNQRCCVTERGSDPEGFIATHKILSGWDQQVFISAAAVKDMAREFGLVPQQEVEKVKQALVELESKYADLRDYAEQAKRTEEAREKVVA
jgi:hypothetical protein